jgi:hypothetical protein
VQRAHRNPFTLTHIGQDVGLVALKVSARRPIYAVVTKADRVVMPLQSFIGILLDEPVGNAP